MGKFKKTPYRFNLPTGRNSRLNRRKAQTLEQQGALESNEQPPIKITLGKKYQNPYSCRPSESGNNSQLNYTFTRKYPVTLDLSGSRVINVDNLGKEVMRITFHAAVCPAALVVASQGKKPIKFLGVGKTAGLACYLHSRCVGCGKRFVFCSSKKLSALNGARRYEANVRGVWGQMVTGGGGSHLQEQMATLEIPTLHLSNFCVIEDDIRIWWEKILVQELSNNGKEEKRLAEDNNQYHEGVPAITVITDGGWSKRTHKHTYNALGGVAVIFGARTGKLLHIGVRCKFCHTCSRHKGKGTTPPKHECFKNWSSSSQSMASDILLQGFKECEEIHGVRYMNMIGDGDSSTYAKLISCGPSWCRYLKKIECTNHATKCLRTHLEKLVTDNPNYKGRHGLTKDKRVHIVTYIRYAIRQRSTVTNLQEAVKLLDKDIRTSMWHVYGRHTHCNTDICNGNNPNKKTIFHSTSESANADIDALEEVINDQFQYHEQGSNERDQIDSSYSFTRPLAISKEVKHDVSSILDKFAMKAGALVTNKTTNLCESWMAVRAKFDGGKQINRCGKGSWFARCYGAALRSSLGAEWSPKVWKGATKEQPGKTFLHCYRNREIALQSSKKSKSNADVRRRAIKRKYARLQQSRSKAAKQEYGSDCLQVEPDVSPEELEATCLSFYEAKVFKTSEALESIELNTQQQSLDGLWYAERSTRLTSSNFSAIIKRRPNTSVVPLLKRLLYSTFKGNRYTDYGLVQEENTIEAYKQHMLSIGTAVNVRKSGLVVSRQFPFLACSPDGVVTEGDANSSGLIEMKNVLMGKTITISQAASSIPTFCIHKAQDGTLSLKTTHPYYMQCQGQLAICEKEWLDFVIRTTSPNSILVERIYPDEPLWSNNMLPKLTSFYFEAYLPELSVPRNGKEPGIRDRQKGLNSKLHSEPVLDPTPSTSGLGLHLDPHTDRQTQDKDSCGEKAKKFPRVKFVGKHVKHKWVLDENTQEFKWYKGQVVKVLMGRDGTLKNTMYEVTYDGEDTPYELSRTEIIEDLNEGSLEFVEG